MIVPSLVEDLTRAFQTARVEMMAVRIEDATIIAVTEEVLKRWNCRREDVFNKSLAKFGTGTLSARYIDEGGGQQRIAITYSPPLGGTRVIHFTSQSWSHDGQAFMILIGQHGDKAEAEDAIQNAHRLKLALRSGGYAIWDYDYRTGTTYNSPEIYDLLGFPRDSSELDFDRFNERVHPEDLDKTLDEKIRTSPFGADLFQTKYRVKAANGEYLWIESVAGVVRDPASGKPAKTVGLCRNISDQMHVLEKIRLSERNLKRSQAAAGLGSFFCRVDDKSSKLSSEMIALLGLGNAIIAPTLADFEQMIEEDARERFRAALDKAHEGTKTAGLEITVRVKSGEVDWFQCNIEPERGRHGRVESIFGTCQCITERKLLENKFLQAQKMEAVGQLTGGIAHDFNNLLMVVMGNLQLVEHLVKGDERAAKRIRAAIDAAEKSSELTKRLLAFSRQQTLQKRDVSVNDLILRMEDILRQALGQLIELKIIPGKEIAAVSTDAMMLETAILNLVINARDAMRPAGTLVIETSNVALDADYCKDIEDLPPGDYIEIAVTDTGCGIPKENIDKVFQPFFTTKPPEAGSGLGLSMIYGYVKQSGGHIKVYSEVGHGTTVKLYLPIAKAMGAAKPAQPDWAEKVEAAALPAAPQGRKPVILIVEDNESVRNVAAAMIDEMGFEALEAASGAEALQVLEERKDIELVLSDVIMAGGMNGPELASRATQLRPALKVLFMSGYAAGSVREVQGLPDTADLVNKPFTRNDLTTKVRRALAA